VIAFGDGDGGVLGVALAGGLLLAHDGAVRVLPAPRIAERDGGALALLAADGLEIALAPLAPAAALGDGTIQVCRAHGGSGTLAFDGVGTIGRSEAAGPVALERWLSVWLGPQLTIALAAQRPRGAGGHGEERIAATILRGEVPAAAAVGDGRISTTYDGDGRPIHCGIELWESDDSEFADRAAGEAIAHGELPGPDGATTIVTFLACHGQGRRGPGVYLLTRRD